MLHKVARFTEDQAREYLETIRWPNGPVCAHCGAAGKSGKMEGVAHRTGLYKCYACRRQYSVTVGTVMHRSKIPLHKWVMAFHLLTSSKKGFSALQLQRNLGLGSYRTAWHMAHRIRLAMRQQPLGGKHLDRYCEEFNFRWDRRLVSDAHRAADLIRNVGGKRLTYKPLKGLA